jgi:hypothetical protein
MKRKQRSGVLRLSEDYRKWENSHYLCAFGMDGVAPGDVDRAVGQISAVIAEFNLPLGALNGNVNRPDDVRAVEDLILETTSQGVIDFNRAFARLRESTIEYGVVVLVNPGKYRLKEPLALYGQAEDEGFIVLVRWDIANAVRHEFGHMVGLDHHEGCAMVYKCTAEQFCANCRREIKEIWAL